MANTVRTTTIPWQQVPNGYMGIPQSVPVPGMLQRPGMIPLPLANPRRVNRGSDLPAPMAREIGRDRPGMLEHGLPNSGMYTTPGVYYQDGFIPPGGQRSNPDRNAPAVNMVPTRPGNGGNGGGGGGGMLDRLRSALTSNPEAVSGLAAGMLGAPTFAKGLAGGLRGMLAGQEMAAARQAAAAERDQGIAQREAIVEFLKANGAGEDVLRLAATNPEMAYNVFAARQEQPEIPAALRQLQAIDLMAQSGALTPEQAQYQRDQITGEADIRRAEEDRAASKAEQEAADAEKAAVEAGQRNYVDSQSSTAIQTIDEALELSTSGAFGSTGPYSLLSERVPGTEARRLEAKLATIRGLVAVDELQKMREASPTGGALGQITERELAMLQALRGSLDRLTGEAEIDAVLRRIRQSYATLREINGLAPYVSAPLPGTTDSAAPETDGGDGWTEIDGVRIRMKE